MSYIEKYWKQHLTGWSLEDLPDDRDEWQQRERERERDRQKSVLAAQHDDDDDDETHGVRY